MESGKFRVADGYIFFNTPESMFVWREFFDSRALDKFVSMNFSLESFKLLRFWTVIFLISFKILLL